MPEHRRGDAERLLEFVADAASIEGPRPFTSPLLDHLATLLGCEFATFYTFDPARSTRGADRGEGYVPCSREALYQMPPDGWGGAPGLVDVRLSGVHLWSDALPRGARRRYETVSYAKVFEVVDSLWTVVPVAPNERAMLNLHRQGDDFTEHDRRFVGALLPHISALIRNARARRQLAHLMAAVDPGPEEPQGFLLIGADHAVEHASPSARVLVRRWLEVRDGELPVVVRDWLGSGTPREPFVVESGGRRLVVESPRAGALLLREESAPTALTPREREVLRCLAAGHSTAEIARLLWVTPATVSKHLERSYRKLGVSSRTAALAASGLTARQSPQ